MLKFKKIFIGLLLSLLFLCSYVLATNNEVNSVLSAEQTTSASSMVAPPAEINQDLYIYNTDYYTFSDKLNGTMFSSTQRLIISPKNNGGIISGDMFSISSDLVIESDVKYSNEKDSLGNFIVDTINSKSIINGNVYAFTNSFTLEAGAEINGDLYVFATDVNIEQDAVIDGNLFIFSENVTFNGKLSGSAYVSASNFKMNYYAYISRDLYLNAQDSTLSGIVLRNAFITSSNTLTALDSFVVHKDLSVNYAKNFTFAGEVKGNATFNVESLNFKTTENDNKAKCTIKGNLTYASKVDTTVPQGIVSGEVRNTKFEDKNVTKFDFQSAFISLITLVIYIFIVVLLIKFVTPKYFTNTPENSLGNVLAGLAIGFLSVFVIFIIFVLLCITGIGITLAFAFLAAYLFIVALALPTLLLSIANQLKLNLNIHLKVLLVSAIYYLITLIPILGATISFLAMLTGIGKLLLPIFNRKK